MYYCSLYVPPLQLLSTCKKVLSLGTHEPLMKLIAGFESIFTKAQVRVKSDHAVNTGNDS